MHAAENALMFNQLLKKRNLTAQDPLSVPFQFLFCRKTLQKVEVENSTFSVEVSQTDVTVGLMATWCLKQ